MKKNLLLVLIYSLIILLPSLSIATVNKELTESESLERYYQNLFIGEKRTSNYFGPLDPRASFSEENGDLLLLDEQFKTHYLNDNIQADALVLYHFWFTKIIEKSTCPDSTLGENIDYIRYLYRLLSISYLFDFYF